MARIWRKPGVLMSAYLVLAMIAGTWASTRVPTPAPQAQQLPDMGSVLIAAFLAWRVTRGGAIARGLVVAFTALLIWSLVVSPDMQSGGLVSLGLLVICIIQLALLVSSPVYERTRKDWAGQSPGAAPIWPVPRWWMALAAVAAGAAITLLFLASMDWQTVPCALAPRPATPTQCTALAEGYPVRFLSAMPSASGGAAYPVVDMGAAAEDFTVWTLLSFSACYLIWLPSRRPAESATARIAAPV